MSDMNMVTKLISLFCSNADGVLTTITNNQMVLNPLATESFDFEKVSEDIELPAVMMTLNFAGDQNFQSQLLLPKKLVAILADLMMLGDGDVDYFPEEHNEALQEMFNQVLGSLASELAADSISLTGTVTKVELTDMEIQKDFLEDNQMVHFSLIVLDQEFHMYMFLDDFAGNSIETLFNNAEAASAASKPAAPSGPPPSRDILNALNPNAPEPQYDGPPVNVSRAQFSHIEESRGPVSDNVNMELLYDIVLPITVELGRKNMKIKEILEMGQGSVIELDKTAGDYVDLIVNGKKFAIGEVMVADDNYAVRIVSLVSRKERIKTLGD